MEGLNLRYFKANNINVMCWNYRGYGRSIGGRLCRKRTLTPKVLRQDGKAVLDFCRNDLGLQGKIGIYGRSLGGLVASHMAH